MTKKVKDKMVFYILLSMLIFNVIVCTYEGIKINAIEPFIAFQSDSPISGQAAKEIWEKKQKKEDFVLWSESTGRRIQNPLLKRTKEVNAIEAVGNVSLLFPDAVYLSGTDIQGCIIDEKTVNELWGATNPVGSKISYNNKIYYLRGVITSQIPVFIIANNFDNTQFDRVTFRKNNSKINKTEFIRKFNANFSVNFILVDRGFWVNLINISFVILVILLLSEIIFRLNFIKLLKKKASNNVLFLLSCFLGASLIVILFYYINVNLEVLPTKWSNFSFWTDYKNTIKESFTYQLQHPVSSTEMNFYFSMFRFSVFYFLSLAMNFIIVLKWKNVNNGMRYLLAKRGEQV